MSATPVGMMDYDDPYWPFRDFLLDTIWMFFVVPVIAVGELVLYLRRVSR